MKQFLSDRIKATPASFIRSILKVAADPSVISFAGGLPNPAAFPSDALLASMERVVATYGDQAFQYSLTAGLPQLRQTVAQRYAARFGLDVTADDILITTGSQQALDLLGKVLLNKGDRVVVEKPSYLGAIQAFSQYEPAFVPVELTREGMDTTALKDALATNPKLIYTIPDFQNPTGLTYSAARREEIYGALRGCDVVLVEDDPYGDLRFEGERLPYIGAGRLPLSVVLGTFSKTVTPGMRVGYLLCRDRELLRYLSVAKEASDLHTNVFAQFVIWDYLEHNDYDAHIARIRNLYQTRAQAMMDAMDRWFPSSVRYTRPKGGMFLWVELPEGVSARTLFDHALERGVAFVPGDPFYTDGRAAHTMRLNFTNADPATIEEGIKRLGQAIEELLAMRP